jgi:hypothetical protein
MKLKGNPHIKKEKKRKKVDNHNDKASMKSNTKKIKIKV